MQVRHGSHLPLRIMRDHRLVLGKKVGMTQVFTEGRCLVPVTVVEVLPSVVSQIRTPERDGYSAIQLAYGERKVKNLSKGVLGHLKLSAKESCEGLKEFRVDDVSGYELGASIDSSIFSVGERIDVIGQTKGHGFQGVVKRHGFSGGPAGHGSMFHRRGGSYGCREWPGKVWKGRKMPGHDGSAMRTVQNLEIVDIVSDRNIVLIQGSLPGYNGGLVVLRKAAKAK